MKGKKRQQVLEEKRKRKSMIPSGKSNYALKSKYLKKNGGMGFEYLEKPWKSSK